MTLAARGSTAETEAMALRMTYALRMAIDVSASIALGIAIAERMANTGYSRFF
jgi:hypothetical protein